MVRNLFACACLGLAVWASARLGLWSGEVVIPHGTDPIRIELAHISLLMAVGLSFTGAWMVRESKLGKIRGRERFLDQIAWTGQENVLDVGCGRGLLLIGAARRLTSGRATGIDIWQTEDLSGNRPEATLENARREDVEARVDIKTADMRDLSFADNSFDVVVSRAAIHNLYAAADRASAIREVARVLKPGGHALIEDIRHGREYEAVFAKSGCGDIRQVGSKIEALLTMLVTFGSLRPVTLLVRKA